MFHELQSIISSATEDILASKCSHSHKRKDTTESEMLRNTRGVWQTGDAHYTDVPVKPGDSDESHNKGCIIT